MQLILPSHPKCYLASLLAVDEQNFMEKTYINELARQLNLPLELQNEARQPGAAGFGLDRF